MPDRIWFVICCRNRENGVWNEKRVDEPEIPMHEVDRRFLFWKWKKTVPVYPKAIEKDWRIKAVKEANLLISQYQDVVVKKCIDLGIDLGVGSRDVWMNGKWVD